MTLGDGANARSSRYAIARVVRSCPCCGSDTRLLALLLPAGHETLDPDAAEPAWGPTDAPACLFHLEHITDCVRRRLVEVSCGFGRLAGSSNWANHCESCGTAFDDQELFCEPGGAFSPTDPEEAAALQLTVIEEPLRVRAAGYELAPEFFEFPSS